MIGDHQEHLNSDPRVRSQLLWQRQRAEPCPPLLVPFSLWIHSVGHEGKILPRKKEKKKTKQIFHYLYPDFKLLNIVCYGNYCDPIQHENKPIQTKVSPSAVCPHPPPPFIFFPHQRSDESGNHWTLLRSGSYSQLCSESHLCNQQWKFTTERRKTKTNKTTMYLPSYYFPSAFGFENIFHEPKLYLSVSMNGTKPTMCKGCFYLSVVKCICIKIAPSHGSRLILKAVM